MFLDQKMLQNLRHKTATKLLSIKFLFNESIEQQMALLVVLFHRKKTECDCAKFTANLGLCLLILSRFVKI